MGLFGLSEKTVESKLANIDEDTLAKRALAALEIQAKESFSSVDDAGLAAIVLHHDLQEIKKTIENK